MLLTTCVDTWNLEAKTNRLTYILALHIIFLIVLRFTKKKKIIKVTKLCY